MSFSKYRIRLLIRILIILSLAFAGMIIVLETTYWLVGIWTTLIIVLLVMELMRFHERSQSSFREFLTSIKQEDFSTLNKLDESDRELQKAYQLIQL